MATLQEWDQSYIPKYEPTGCEISDVTDDWYDEEGNLIP